MGPTAQMTEEDIDAVFAVNVKVPFVLVAELASPPGRTVQHRPGEQALLPAQNRPVRVSVVAGCAGRSGPDTTTRWTNPRGLSICSNRRDRTTNVSLARSSATAEDRTSRANVRPFDGDQRSFGSDRSDDADHVALWVAEAGNLPDTWEFSHGEQDACAGSNRLIQHQTRVSDLDVDRHQRVGV
jgi:hypothetical protein